MHTQEEESNMSESITINVPGKLFIAGEYAVTRSQGCAMIAAVAADFKVSVTKTTEQSYLTTNVGMKNYTFDMNHFEVPENNWNFALAALRIMLDETQKKQKMNSKMEWPQLAISIKSDLGFGKNKKGYGSSASVVVGVVRAVSLFLKIDVPVFEYAAKAHYNVQGSGSMGDVAAISQGSVCFYQAPDKNWQNWKIKTFSDQEWQKQGFSDVYIVETGKAIKTDEKLSLQFPDCFYKKSDQIVHDLEKCLWSQAYSTKKFKKFKYLLLKNQQLLIDCLPAAYVTDELALALKLINVQKNLVGKISGSGFGENMIVFAKNEKGIKKIREKLGRKGMILKKIRITGEIK